MFEYCWGRNLTGMSSAFSKKKIHNYENLFSNFTLVKNYYSLMFFFRYYEKYFYVFRNFFFFEKVDDMPFSNFLNFT